MDRLKLTEQKKEDFKRAEMLHAVWLLKDRLDAALLKADKYEIEKVYEEFKAKEKEFYEYVSK